MKFHTHSIPHANNATARTRPSRPLRILTLGLASALIFVFTLVPTTLAASAEEIPATPWEPRDSQIADEMPSNESIDDGCIGEIPAVPPSSRIDEDPVLPSPNRDEDTGEIPFTPFARRIIPQSEETVTDSEVSSDTSTRSGSRIYYPYPSGAMAVTLYKDGKRILQGHVADIGGTVYVPVQRFADQFGSFRTSYTEATEQVVITGTNLSITVKVGDPYITVNDRIFYTGSKVISLGGWIFVPLTAMCKAMGASVTIRSGYYDAFITSGNPAAVPSAAAYYDSTDLYWLSRIISAEARGESFEGQIAVGNVVLNRVRSSQFPSTVKGVIFDTKYGTQFAPAANGTVYNAPTASAIRAAKVCLEGYSLSSRILYFYNPYKSASSWISRTRPYVMTIGNHKFYA